MQAAREAARRLQCSNNLKQIALALHNYESVHSVLAAGEWGRGGNAANDNHSGWAWHILPYIEQTAGTDRVSFSYSGFLRYDSHPNKLGFHNLIPPSFYCPSSMAKKLARRYLPPDITGKGAPVNIAVVEYTAIQGSAVDPVDPSRVESTLHGIASDNGMLPLNAMIKIDEGRDGTSNTIMLGEMSGLVISATGQPIDFRKSARFGAWMGCQTADRTSDSGPMQAYGISGFIEGYNSVTVRYPINYRGFTNVISDGFYFDGIRLDPIATATYYANNTPIHSPHPGGAHVALTDGSIRFFSESMDLNVLYRYANRDDQEVIDQ